MTPMAMPESGVEFLYLLGKPANEEKMESAFGFDQAKRKLRLFTVACCRQIESLMPDDLCRQAIDIVEQFADGLIGDPEREKMRNEIAKVKEKYLNPYNQVASYAQKCLWEALSGDGDTIWDNINISAAESVAYAFAASHVNTLNLMDPKFEVYRDQEDREQAKLLADVVGLMFSTITPSRLRVSSTIKALADEIYSSRDFTGLGILADALEDAGCQERALLQHCRSPGPHIKGCWALDLIRFQTL